MMNSDSLTIGGVGGGVSRFRGGGGGVGVPKCFRIILKFSAF